MSKPNEIEEEEDSSAISALEQEEEEEQELVFDIEDDCDEVLDETESTKKYWAEQRQIDNFDFGFLEEDFYHSSGYRDFMNSSAPTEQ